METNNTTTVTRIINRLTGKPDQPLNSAAIKFGMRMLPMLGVTTMPDITDHTTATSTTSNPTMNSTTPDETTLSGRAESRMRYEGQKQQQNLENISLGALSFIEEDAKPDDVEDDWLSNYYDKGRLVSDKDMQQLWSHILASEVNNPGSFSLRTVNLLSSLKKSEALLFRKLCSYVWQDFSPSKYSHNVAVITPDMCQNSEKYGFNFGDFFMLQDIGLINFQGDAEMHYSFNSGNDDFVELGYHGNSFRIRAKNKAGELLPRIENLLMGSIMLTISGKEIAQICSPEPDLSYMNYILSFFRKQDMQVDSI